MSDPTLVPIDPSTQTPEPAKKNRVGAPFGNRNALKHGLFIQGNYLRNLNPVEKAQLHDTKDLIEHFKRSMEHLYEISINSKDILEVNLSIRSMASAAMALTRLLYAQEEHSQFRLAVDYRPDRDQPVTRHSFIHGLVKDIENIVDLSELKELLAADDEQYAAELESNRILSGPPSLPEGE